MILDHPAALPSSTMTAPQHSPNRSESTVVEPVQQDLEKQESADPATPTPAAEKTFPETDLSRGIVGWDSQDDPANLQNFAEARKWGLLLLISGFTLISPLASSMFSPAISYMAADFGETNETILSFTVSVFLLGYAVCLIKCSYAMFCFCSSERVLLTNNSIHLVRSLSPCPAQRDIWPPDRVQLRQLVLRYMADWMRTGAKYCDRGRMSLFRRRWRIGLSYSWCWSDCGPVPSPPTW